MTAWYTEEIPISEGPYTFKGLPDWEAFDNFAHNYITRIIWMAIYIVIYAFLTIAWWQWLFLPATVIMGSQETISPENAKH
ncbi:hypothetical protein [Chryseobacterium sp. Leaf405]|uniref:hypothetical protein n=1 Tax=Chryseobacterium sp. Leaf405 TaxID=1736367 RepID=UPI0039648A5F